ncbi:MAG: rod shape-determining protein RodA [Leptospiraceae bacterium]|nr:rod shape-determining protein RodA [Leptospiraceae bacterium]
MLERRLDRLDYVMIFCVLFVVSCGIITLYFQEYNFSDGTGKWYRQILFACIGFVLMYFMTRINYQFLGSYAAIIYLVAILLLIATLIPGIGYVPLNKGARSWIKLGPFSLQTSEFAKLATVIALGQYLVVKEREIRSLSVLLLPFVIVLIPMGLIYKQPDFGTAVSFLPMLLAMLFLGGADVIHLLALIILGGISLIVPMYVEYTKLTLVAPLSEHIAKTQTAELTGLMSRLGGKVWVALKGKPVKIGENLVTISPKSTELLREASEQVIEENTGFFFKFLINEELMLGLGLIMLIASLIFLILRFTQGQIALRKYYIPIGMLGLSIFAATFINKVAPFSENQVVRLVAFINPDQFKQGAGYQLRASKPAIGSGRFFGKGLTKGEMTEGSTPHVPESSTDFIFASWAERTGFIWSAILLFFLLAIPLRGLQVSYESKDRFGSLLAAGIVALIFFHMFINIGIVLGLMPVTGLPLSFMSYGGSHLIMSMVAVGIIISIKIRKHAN